MKEKEEGKVSYIYSVSGGGGGGGVMSVLESGGSDAGCAGPSPLVLDTLVRRVSYVRVICRYPFSQYFSMYKQTYRHASSPSPSLQ